MCNVYSYPQELSSCRMHSLSGRGSVHSMSHTSLGFSWSSVHIHVHPPQESSHSTQIGVSSCTVSCIFSEQDTKNKKENIRYSKPVKEVLNNNCFTDIKHKPKRDFRPILVRKFGISAVRFPFQNGCSFHEIAEKHVLGIL